MKLLNLKLMSHPINWVTITVMLLLAGAFGHLLLEYLGHSPDTKERRSAWTEQPAGQSPGQEAAGAIDPQGSLQV
jgi:hypothetical protein